MDWSPATYARMGRQLVVPVQAMAEASFLLTVFARLHRAHHHSYKHVSHSNNRRVDARSYGSLCLPDLNNIALLHKLLNRQSFQTPIFDIGRFRHLSSNAPPPVSSFVLPPLPPFYLFRPSHCETFSIVLLQSHVQSHPLSLPRCTY